MQVCQFEQTSWENKVGEKELLLIFPSQIQVLTIVLQWYQGFTIYHGMKTDYHTMRICLLPVLKNANSYTNLT